MSRSIIDNTVFWVMCGLLSLLSGVINYVSHGHVWLDWYTAIITLLSMLLAYLTHKKRALLEQLKRERIEADKEDQGDGEIFL